MAYRYPHDLVRSGAHIVFVEARPLAHHRRVNLELEVFRLIEIAGEQTQKGATMGDFLKFETMITAAVIEVIFYLAVVVLVIAGITQIVTGGLIGLITGLLTIVLGPLLARVYCEIVIVFFRINDHLRAIQHNTERT